MSNGACVQGPLLSRATYYFRNLQALLSQTSLQTENNKQPANLPRLSFYVELDFKVDLELVWFGLVI